MFDSGFYELPLSKGRVAIVDESAKKYNGEFRRTE